MDLSSALESATNAVSAAGGTGETRMAGQPSTLTQTLGNTVISKIGAYSDDECSYLSEDGLKLNIDKDGTTPILFGVETTEGFNSLSYSAHNFAEARYAFSKECYAAIKEFDKGITINSAGTTLTKITYQQGHTLPTFSSGSLTKETYGNSVVGKMGNITLAFFTEEFNGEKYDLAFEYRSGTLMIDSFYVSKYVNNFPTSYTAASMQVEPIRDNREIFLDSKKESAQTRGRNIIAANFNEIPDSARFIGQKIIYYSNFSRYDTTFAPDNVFSDRGYPVYYSLCFESGGSTYEIGFPVNVGKYFIPTVAEIDSDVVELIMVDESYRYNHAAFIKCQKSITKRDMSNLIVGLYMTSEPSKMRPSSDGKWAPYISGSDIYPVKYISESRDIYYKVEVEAYEAKDPKEANGSPKKYTFCSSGFDSGIRNALIRKFNNWKRFAGGTYENGKTAEAYDIGTGKKSNSSVSEIRPYLSSGTEITEDTELYKVEYRKIKSGEDLYVKNNKLYNGGGAESLTGNPFGDRDKNLINKFEAYGTLEGHEGKVPCFYSCPTAAITYGVGFTWMAVNRGDVYEVELWRDFFKKAGQMGIWVSLEDSLLKDLNNGLTSASYKLEQSGTGHIYFLKRDGTKLDRIRPDKGTTLLPYVPVSEERIKAKFTDIITKKDGYAEKVYTYVIGPIETKKSGDRMVKANVPFELWLGDTSGNYTIRSKITQWQWDCMVDCVYQGNYEHFFNTIRKSENTAGAKQVDTFREFCQRALEGIDATERAKPSWFLRGAEWRKTLREAFSLSKIPPDDITTTNNNEKDDKQYFAHKITITCCSLGRGKIKTVMPSQTSGRKPYNPKAYISYNSYSTNDVNIENVYYIESYYEADKVNYADSVVKVTKDEMDWGRFKKIVNRWSCEIEKQPKKEQKLIGVDRYYDFYAGMTPYIQAYFRETNGSSTTWNILNSLQHPYFKSLVVEDKGVKTLTLTLFDKDFGSYQYGIVVDEDSDPKRYTIKDKEAKSKKIYSLETIIKKALVQNSSADLNRDESRIDKDKKSGYEDFTEEELKDTYLKYDDSKSADCTNLKVRFGYADDNPPTSEGEAKKTQDPKDGEKYIKYNDEKYDRENPRDYRWYDVRRPGIEKAMQVIPKVYYDGSNIVEGNTSVKISSNDTMKIDNSYKVELDEEEKNNEHMDLTTLRSYVRNYMIIGYETSLKPNGIQYTIKAVETGYASLMKKRFLQRYHELTSNPIEVLAALMTIFNEPQEGKPNTKSGFKIYYAKAPEEDADAADTINMLFDFGALSDEDREKYSWAKDSYTVQTSGKSFDVKLGREIYKKITVKLGGESALGNMNRTENHGNRALYKSVASLMDEFCSACPSKKFNTTTNSSKAYDKDGNEIVNDSYESQARLGWFLGTYEDSSGKDISKELCVVLYYKRPRKLGRIRVYRWGPELPYKTVVKNLSIKNNNEFAILSAVDTFTAGPSGAELRCKVNVKNMGLAKVTDQKLISKNLSVVKKFTELSDHLDTQGAEMVGYVAGNEKAANQYDLAFASCMYTGTMEILGDPSLEFNMLLQPYTYPIKLEVYVPRNELSFRVMDWGMNDIENGDGDENQKAKSRENQKNDNKDLRKQMDDATKEYGSRTNVGLHQIHEMSGYYVITSITHNISSSGYTTTLGLASYPNIERDVLNLKDDNKTPAQPTYLY